MGSKSHQNASSSRLGLKATVGEVVEVQGGHIVRSTGRKDRHSKVCTAKGPRDRRVRLAAYTAIQFYDVQDRLGYDRPSKAVDWLIKKAKAAIDELAEIPPWHPTASSAPNKIFNSENAQKKLEEETQQDDLVISNVSNEFAANNCDPQNSSFLPASMDSDAIADTMKSFFPTGGSNGASSSAMQQFQSFTTQDLRLSLQSFQDPVLLHQNPSQANAQTLQGQVLLSATPLGFDGWPEQNHHHYQAPELSRFQRPTSWNSTGDSAAAGNGGGAISAGFLFNSPPAPQPLLQQLLGHNQFFSQRGPLQSSNSSSTRAWMDPPTPDHSQNHHQIYPSSVSGIGFAPDFGGFSGFRIPARIQGEEEEHDGYSDKPSSASSDSRH